MNTLWDNATLWFTERELEERDALVRQCVALVSEAWTGMNAAIRLRRVETPILTPAKELAGHASAGFGMLDTKRGMLRPETTAGCIAALHALYPNEQQLRKAMPICLWQVGTVFRDEEHGETMRATRLRLREFRQLEFELFCADSTKADYVRVAATALIGRFGGTMIEPQVLPHYSRMTIDWEIDGLEVAGCSERTDWPLGRIYEASIGLDRLLAMILGRHT